jgi:hypothetical protein
MFLALLILLFLIFQKYHCDSLAIGWFYKRWMHFKIIDLGIRLRDKVCLPAGFPEGLVPIDRTKGDKNAKV